MTLKEKVKTYSFWVSLVSAVLIVVRIVGEHFGLFINESLIMDIVTGVCGVLVLLGILSSPTKKETNMENLNTETNNALSQQLEINEQIKQDVQEAQLSIEEQINLLKKQATQSKQTTETEKTTQETLVVSEQLVNKNDCTNEQEQELSSQECIEDEEVHLKQETQAEICEESIVLQEENVLTSQVLQTNDETLNQAKIEKNATAQIVCDVDFAMQTQEISQQTIETENTQVKQEEVAQSIDISGLSNEQLKALMAEILLKL